ncbi:MAG TPA: methyltransferase domain-containing protein [Chthonomonadales bacterium]|nr:methyltransferase domain-containing protein [Chthonomonadales bacterium]
MESAGPTGIDPTRILGVDAAADTDELAARLEQTRAAFDSVAEIYDGPRGNNSLVQAMRRRLWQEVDRLAPAGARLLDLGCGAGIDAERFAMEGFHVTAADWSARMAERTLQRAQRCGLLQRVEVLNLGIQEVDQLPSGNFDLIYSNLGAMNCAPDLAAAACSCWRLLRPGGAMVVSAIGRFCPWEIAIYLARLNPRRGLVRFRRGSIPVRLNGGTVWTRYFTPGEFARACAGRFRLERCRGLSIFTPPPYFEPFCLKHPTLTAMVQSMDDRLGSLPGLRAIGDHFLISLRRVNERAYGEMPAG